MRAALEAELPQLRPAVLRARFHLTEEGDPADVVATLERIRRRGSHGILLKAPDHPLVARAVDELAAAGVPTVTLVTDVPDSRRVAYVGIDNRAAGATAAYLITRTSGPDPGTVLLSLSSSRFHGEGEREAGFRQAMAELAPDRLLVEVTETDGLHGSTLAAVAGALAEDPAIDAVYSIGGGNTAILEAFRAVGRAPTTFVAHDLDGDNVAMLRRRQLTAVLHHDLRRDLAEAARLILHARGALPGRPWSRTSQIQVITPFNLPSSSRPPAKAFASTMLTGIMTSNDYSSPAVDLAEGGRMPLLGFGTWQIERRRCHQATSDRAGARLPPHRHRHRLRQRGRDRSRRWPTPDWTATRSSSPPSCRPTTPAGSARPSRRA